MKSYVVLFIFGVSGQVGFGLVWAFKYFDRVHFNPHQLVYVRASEEENIQEESL